MSYRSVNTIKFSNIPRDRFKREIRKRGDYSDLRNDEIVWKEKKERKRASRHEGMSLLVIT